VEGITVQEKQQGEKDCDNRYDDDDSSSNDDDEKDEDNDDNDGSVHSVRKVNRTMFFSVLYDRLLFI
jgi:hypothetical protein